MHCTVFLQENVLDFDVDANPNLCLMIIHHLVTYLQYVSNHSPAVEFPQGEFTRTLTQSLTQTLSEFIENVLDNPDLPWYESLCYECAESISLIVRES